MTDVQVDVPVLATPQHRLGAVAVDIGLIFATSIIGWAIYYFKEVKPGQRADLS